MANDSNNSEFEIRAYLVRWQRNPSEDTIKNFTSRTTMSTPSLSHIFILGGSGRIGKDLISRALSQGHRVTALVRRADSLEPHTGLDVVVGSVTSSTDILNALTSIAKQYPAATTTRSPPRVAIMFTLGQTRASQSNPWSTPTSPALYMSQSVRAVIDALRLLATNTTTEVPPALTVTKFIACSMFGTGDSRPHMHWLFRQMIAHSNMKQTLDDHEAVIDIVAANFGPPSPTKFVIVRPAILKFDLTGEVAPVKEWGSGSGEMGFMPKIDARAVAEFCLRAIEDGRWDGTMPVISN